MQHKRMFIHDYTRVGFYMITIMTAGRRPLFGVCQDDCVNLSSAGKTLGNANLEVWEESYHDRIIMNSETLREERRYIDDNPRRYCLCKAHPDLFVKVTHLESLRLPQGMDWSGFGNLFLLEKPELMPVQISRTATEDEVAMLKAMVADRVSRGTVMVSPFISSGEKDIATMVIEQDYGSLILLKPDGFSSLYKPSRAYIDLCAKGRLLVLSSFSYTGRRQNLTRERCLQMNRWVRDICGNNVAKQ
jgi:hypothetical protein